MNFFHTDHLLLYQFLFKFMFFILYSSHIPISNLSHAMIVTGGPINLNSCHDHNFSKTRFLMGVFSNIENLLMVKMILVCFGTCLLNAINANKAH